MDRRLAYPPPPGTQLNRHRVRANFRYHRSDQETGQLGYVGLLLYVFAFYTRPWELYPVFGLFSNMNLLAALGALGSVQAWFSRQSLLRVPQVYLMAAFVGMTMISTVLGNSWPGGSIWALSDISPVLFVFLCIVLHINSLRRLRVVAALLVVAGCLIVAQGLLAYELGLDRTLYLQQSTEEVSEDGGPLALARLRHVGVLNDPNDLAQFLLIALALLPVIRRPGKEQQSVLIVLIPAVLFIWGIYLTRSRGGLLGLVVLIFLWLSKKIGKRWAVPFTAFVLLSLLALNFTGGRAMSADDGSSQGRVEAWSEGIQMLKSSPLWGVGYKSFVDLNRLTAHNSFVLCFAELGLLGFFAWLGMITMTMRQLKVIENAAESDGSRAELSSMARTLRGSLLAFLVPAWFLSRTYNLSLYILLGLSIALIACARQESEPLGDPQTRKSLRQTGVLMVATIVVVYLTIRVGR